MKNLQTINGLCQDILKLRTVFFVVRINILFILPVCEIHTIFVTFLLSVLLSFNRYDILEILVTVITNETGRKIADVK